MLWTITFVDIWERFMKVMTLALGLREFQQTRMGQGGGPVHGRK